MVITKNRIFSPERYLFALIDEEPFYVAAQITADEISKLQTYGFRNRDEAWVPTSIGNATSINAEGRWSVRRDLPKELRAFQREYHVKDWHGYHHHGICWHHRMCYQRELIQPTEIAFTLEGETLYSPLFHNVPEEMRFVKLAINILLEMLGRCEILNSEKLPAEPPINQHSVPWEILRSGTRKEEDWKDYIDRIVERRPKKQQNIIRQRHEFLWEMKPDFCVLGTQNFWGYVVYGFEKQGLYIFECNKSDNATYVFSGDWEAASQLTKTEILAGGLQEARIFHTENWKHNIKKLVSEASTTNL